MKETLTFFQHNIHKQDSVHQTVLEQAFQQQVDIVLLQEPYVGGNEVTGFYTLPHPNYTLVLPQQGFSLSNIPIRPRVLTYVRKGVGIQYNPRYDLFSQPDSHAHEINDLDEP